MKLWFIGIIIIASLLEYFGDSNFKFFSRTGKYDYLMIGTIMYIVMVVILIKILKSSNVMFMNMNWDAMSIIIETVLAYILLNETLDNRYQLLGFVVIIIGILLLNIGNIPYA